MWEDPIVNEIRDLREKHAKDFDYNLDKIILDLKNIKDNYDKMSIHIIDGKVVIFDKDPALN